MILYSLQVLQTLSWGPWTCTVGFFVGCHCLTWVPLICTSSLGEKVFKHMLGSLNLFSRWLVTKHVPSSDSIQEAPGGFKTRAGLACSNMEALILYIVFRHIQIFHDLSFLVSSDFGFLSFFFGGGVLFPHGPQTSPTQEIDYQMIKCKPHRWEATHFKMVCLNLEISGRMS